MDKDRITLAIVSDLHCRYIGSDSGPMRTYLTSDALRDPPQQHPIEALNAFIDTNGLEADYLLCPGDIADRMDRQGFISGWGYLLELRLKFQAKELLATTGNHDVDSRNKLGLGEALALPKKILQGYPVEDRDNQSRFWANHYHIRSTDNVHFFVFNSAYSHFDEKSANESKIETSILSKIEADFKALGTQKGLRIAMCHHHPTQHANMSYKDGDVMDKGDKLLQLLAKYDFQIIIHGHKHEPRLSYLHEMAVFAAGSFSSHENVRDLGAENVFHMITLHKGETQGEIESFVYSPGKGWYRKTGAYFPTYTGFGCRDQPEQLAKAINVWFDQHAQNLSAGSICSFDDLLIAIPNIKFLIPATQDKLANILEAEYNLFLDRTLADRPVYVTKKSSK